MSEKLQRLYAQKERLVSLLKQIEAAPKLPKSHPRAHEVEELYDIGKEISDAADGLSLDEQTDAQLEGGAYRIRAAELYLELVREQE